MWYFAAVNTFILNACFIFFFFREILGKDISPSDVAPSFAMPFGNVSVKRGHDVSFECEVYNLGNYKLTWVYKEKGTLPTQQERIITNNSRYTISHDDELKYWELTIVGVEESDEGEYECQINTSPMISQSVYVNVLVSPKIDDEYTSSDTEVIEGSYVSLRCRASGSPTPTILWTRGDNKDIDIGMESVFRINGEYLNITKASRLNMGVYLCVAYNGVFPRTLRHIKLIVKFPPTISIGYEMIHAPLDKDVVLVCEIESFPKSETYWKKDGIKILTHSKYNITRIDSGTYESKVLLRIPNLKQEDYGYYTFVAKNALNETEGTVLLYGSSTEFSPLITSSETDGIERNESERHLNNGMDNSGMNLLSSFFSSVILVVGLKLLLHVL